MSKATEMASDLLGNHNQWPGWKNLSGDSLACRTLLHKTPVTQPTEASWLQDPLLESIQTNPETPALQKLTRRTATSSRSADTKAIRGKREAEP